MTARKLTPERKSRSGSYVPEDLRGTYRVRVPRDPADALAKRWGIKAADAVVRAVEQAAAQGSTEE